MLGDELEKDGWLDQILLSVLNVLNQPWLTILVATGGGFIVAYLTRMSPKRAWDYLKEGPAAILTGAFLMLASIKSVPRLVTPEIGYTCDWITGADGILRRTNCRFVTEGDFHTVNDSTFGDFIRDYAVSMGLELAFGTVGAGLGILAAFIVKRRHASSTQ